MTLVSTYRVATPLTPDNVFDLLRDNLDFATRERRSDKFRPRLYTTNDGLMIETYPDKSLGGVEEAFGFHPTVRVDLELARGNAPGFPEGELNTVRTVDWLINHIEGDAVFLANGDAPVLLRRNGKVWLDRKDWFWREQDLKLLTFPYEWKELPKY